MKLKKILLALLLFSSGYLFSQTTPAEIYKIVSPSVQFYRNISQGTKLIDCSTGNEYLSLKSIPSTYSINDCVIGTDLKKVGTVSTISVTANNGITQSITNATTTPEITLGLGDITPTSISTGQITANNIWYLNGNTLGAKKTIGSIDNRDFGIITNNTERLTVLKEGNVGIGTTNPGAKLQINNSSLNPGLKIDHVAAGHAGLWLNTNEYGILVQGNSSLQARYLLKLQGNNGNTEVFYAGSNGNVGIGTTTPFYRIDISGELRLQSTNKLWFGGTTGVGTDYLYSSISGTINTASSLVSSSTVTGTRLISNIAQGTAPLSVTSTTVVPNLNADLLDGYEASHFGTGNGTVTSIATTSPLTGGTITTTGVISINSDTLINWYSKQNKGKIAYDSLNYRYRRGDTATVLLSRNRASHEYLGKYANAVSASTVGTTPDVITQDSYYMPFVISPDEGNSLNTNENFKYIPSLNGIFSNLYGNVYGNITGSSGSCTGNSASASTVDIDTISTSLDARIPFMSSTGGNQNLYMDNAFKYEPGTSTLTVPNLAGNATSSNKTDSIFINYPQISGTYYIPLTLNYETYDKLYATDAVTWDSETNLLYSNISGNAATSTTSGTADVALALDDPSLYNLTDFNSYGAAAYSVPIADGSGGMTWGVTSGGINAKNYATVVATSNVTQSGTGQTIDGQVCNEGATVLCTGQTIKANNGAWLIPESGAWTRRTDMDAWSELYQAYIPIVSGTTYGGSSWYCTIPSTGTLGLNDITFTEFLFPSSVEAGDGLTKTGTTLSTNVDNSTIEIHTDTLRIKDLGITNTKVATGIDAAKIANGSVSNAKFQYLSGAMGTTGAGNLMYSGHPAFSSSTGTAPFTVSSTTKVSNLNADLLDGQDGSYYAVAGTQNIEVHNFSGTDSVYTATSGAHTIIITNTNSSVYKYTVHLPICDNGKTFIIANYTGDTETEIKVYPYSNGFLWFGDCVEIPSNHSATVQHLGTAGYGSNYVISTSELMNPNHVH